MIGNFLAALQFLTIVPLSEDYVRKSGGIRAAVCFPVVGLLLGGILASLDWCIGALISEPLRSALTVVALLLMTGGLHMDGLADSADGVFSSKSREEILRIMKDVHSGPMASAAIASILLLKFAAVAALPPELRRAGLILLPVAGRSALTLTMGLFPYAKTEGTARFFVQAPRPALAIYGSVFLLAAGWILGSLPGLLAAALSLAVAGFLGIWLRRKIGGYTGDTLGAVCETSEFIFLLGMCLSIRFR